MMAYFLFLKGHGAKINILILKLFDILKLKYSDIKMFLN